MTGVVAPNQATIQRVESHAPTPPLCPIGVARLSYEPVTLATWVQIPHRALAATINPGGGIWVAV